MFNTLTILSTNQACIGDKQIIYRHYKYINHTFYRAQHSIAVFSTLQICVQARQSQCCRRGLTDVVTVLPQSHHLALMATRVSCHAEST